MLQRLWPKIEPAVVVLMFCTQNDRQDNSTNIRYEGYQKPYFATAPDGSLVLSGQPVPTSRLQAIKEVWLVRHSWLARLASAVYLKLRHPRLVVPDPTERLVGKLRDFVQARGARFLVGLQYRDPELMRYLGAELLSVLTAPISIQARSKAPIGRPTATSLSPSVCWVCCPTTTSCRRPAVCRNEPAA